MYLRDEGIPLDGAEALKWFRKAGDQGDAPALYNLGWMYQNGTGVPKDFVQAYKWFNLCASFLKSDKRLEQVITERDKLTQYMTPAQIDEAQKLYREWYEEFQARSE